MSRFVPAALAALLAAGLAFVLFPERLADPASLVPPVGRYDVRILRDTWGVPHVFGRRDADVAYGLAWAHAEDDFATIQGALLAARGRLATLLGPEGAPNDYLVALLGIRETVEAGWPGLPPAARALCEGYADGLNHYAALHPTEAVPGLYPVRGQDVVGGFVHKVPLFFDLHLVVQRLLDPSATPARPTSSGSNAIAVAPRRAADGFTRLAVNSHQPWEGPVAWYEAHLRSDEGWDMAGGTFPGAPLILHGHNRHVGWAHTVNKPDLVDVFALELDPADPDRYRFDGGWRLLERSSARLPVKVFGRLRWTFEREVLRSVHGPVVRTPSGTFALRYAAARDVGQVEQWRQMNRARSLDEWLEAMRPQSVPVFNSVVADRTGRIAYVYNARFPARRPGLDWKLPVPGDRADLVWDDAPDFSRMPRVVDPPSGFVQSCNGSPFLTTVGEGNPDASSFGPELGIEGHLTNRGLRARELYGSDPSITREEFARYKFDTVYSADSAMVRAWRALVEGPEPDDRLLRKAFGILRGWDRSTGRENRAAALAVLTLQPPDDNRMPAPDRAALLARLRETALLLARTQGRLDPRWGDVSRLRHGRHDLPLDGAPDVLRAIYGPMSPDSRAVAAVGDSYVMLVEWDREGRVWSTSIHPHGASSNPRSPHYADQSPLFARQVLKPVWLDEKDIRAHLEREYRPGDP
jgi:acyl-homoserine-lactone acylase